MFSLAAHSITNYSHVYTLSHELQNVKGVYTGIPSGPPTWAVN